MKKLFYPLAFLFTMILSGCFDTEQEITIQDDSSGELVNKTDMSSVLSLLKTMGGDSAGKMKDFSKDTVVSLAFMKDSVDGLLDREKYLLSKATLSMVINTAEDKFTMAFRFPYDEPGDMQHLTTLVKKIRNKTLGNQLDAFLPSDKGAANDFPAGDEMMQGSQEDVPEINEYFDLVFENGKISRKMNAEKYAKVSEDQDMKALREMSQLGLAMKIKTVIHLPRPAKKITSGIAVVSENKKKITIEGTIDDFLDDPSKFEYQVEY